MTSDPTARLIDQARRGSPQAIGELLNGCREYLLLLTSQELSARLRTKIAPSDLVQDTFLEAQRDFAGFAGTTRAALLMWLTRMLRNNLHDAVRRYQRCAKRRLSRELPLAPVHQDGGQAVPHQADALSPSGLAMQREEAAVVRQALDALPEDYRRVIVMRNLDLLPFGEIAGRMNRTEVAVRKLWARALRALARDLRSAQHD